MSLNTRVSWSDDRQLLCAYYSDSSEPIFMWSYSTFEKYNREAVSPSMYDYLANYIMSKITKDILISIENYEYVSGLFEEQAVDSYYDLPLTERIEMHQQMLVNLGSEAQRCEDKMHAFIDAFLSEECPFDPMSPIYTDYNTWVRSEKTKWEDKFNEFQNLIFEEECWRSGVEQDGGPMYDPMEEF